MTEFYNNILSYKENENDSDIYFLKIKKELAKIISEVHSPG